MRDGEFESNPFAAPEADLIADPERHPEMDVVYDAGFVRRIIAGIGGLHRPIDPNLLSCRVLLEGLLPEEKRPRIIEQASPFVFCILGWLYSASRNSSESTSDVRKETRGY